MHSFISLDNCVNVNHVSPWNSLINNIISSNGNINVLYGHEAITTTLRARTRIDPNSSLFEETQSEWMVITGGRNVDTSSIPHFYVQMMNLTHADLFGEQIWIQMDHPSTVPIGSACPPYLSNATMDPWRKADLWEDSIPCAPSARVGHLTTVVNEFLYVFHGEAIGEETHEPDYHVYRIALSNVMENSWSSWRRILPRDQILNENATTMTALKGGSWQETPQDLPELVAFTNICFDYSIDFSQPGNQIWFYNFEQDAWYLRGALEDCLSDPTGVILMRDTLMISNDVNVYINLRTMSSMWMEEFFTWGFGISPPWVTYEAADHTSVLVGTNPLVSTSYDLMIATLSFDECMGSLTSANVPVNARESPLSYSLSTAVLSAAGNMYIFGGDGSDGTVWQINVGGKACMLDINWEDNGASDEDNEDCQYDCIGYDPDEKNKLFLLLFFLPMIAWACGFADRQNQASQHQQDRGGNAQQSEITRGLSPEQMEFFPQRVIIDTENEPEQLDSNIGLCSICLVDFVTGDQVRDLPCKHFFHLSCVDGWLQSETTCPLCRVSCRPAVDARQREREEEESLQRALSNPADTILSRWVTWLLAQRERPTARGVPVHGDDTNQSEDDGLEMRSVYSLELHVEDESFDDEDLASTLSNSSSRAHHHTRSSTPPNTGERSDQRITLGRRHRRREWHALRSRRAGCEPLTVETTADSAVL